MINDNGDRETNDYRDLETNDHKDLRMIPHPFRDVRDIYGRFNEDMKIFHIEKVWRYKDMNKKYYFLLKTQKIETLYGITRG